MHISVSLNKEILKMLLNCLLDLRASRSWARYLWHQGTYFYRPQDFYSLIDQLSAQAGESAQHLVQDRLQSLASQTQERLPALLEQAQLAAWQTVRIMEENSQPLFQEESMGFVKKLHETVQALVKLEICLNTWRYRFFYRGLSQSIEFVTRAIRLEMKEILAPQEKVERGIAGLESAHELLEKAGKALEQKGLEEAYPLAAQALGYRPFSLNHQFIELFLSLLLRFELAMKKLSQARRFQKQTYRLYLLERADKALKHTCYLLRLFYQESRLSQSWNERLQVKVDQNWRRMIQVLECEVSRYGQRESMYWRLWSHASIYRLGLGYSGALQRLPDIKEAQHWLRRDNEAANAQLRLVASLLILIDESLGHHQLAAITIDDVRDQLETLSLLKPALKEAIDRSYQDLCLLYTRECSKEHPDLDLPVLEAAGRLLSIGWDIAGPEAVVCCLQCLEDLYDIWAGTAPSVGLK